MSYLQHKWMEYSRQPHPARRYSNQREFEADWIGGLRRRYGLSQETLASLASVSVTTVQNWENPSSRKNIAAHNQDRLRDIERDLWIKSHVTLMEPNPPYIRALHDLIAANRDNSAQGLAEYLVAGMSATDPERPRLLHWAALAYSIGDPASARARQLSEQALEAIGSGDARLAAAIENEILGYQFEDLLTQHPGAERQARGQRLLAACERLFKRDQQAAYKWNALEVACRAPLGQAECFRLVADLTGLLGETQVKRKVLNDPAFEAARPLFAAPAGTH
jgi:transcriptional regulator with XRE-family HTH domain